MKHITKCFIIMIFMIISCNYERSFDKIKSSKSIEWSDIPKLYGTIKSIHSIAFEAGQKDSVIIKRNKVWVQVEPEYTFYNRKGEISKIINRKCLIDKDDNYHGFYYDSTHFQYDIDGRKVLIQEFDSTGKISFQGTRSYKEGKLDKASNKIIGWVCNHWRYEYISNDSTVNELRYWVGNENVKGNDIDLRKKYVYDKLNRVINEYELNENGKTKKITNWKYESNLIVKRDTFYKDLNGLKPIAYIVSVEKYDNLSNLLQRNYYLDGKLERTNSYKYDSLDKHGNWQIRFGYVSDSILFEVFERKIEYFE